MACEAILALKVYTVIWISANYAKKIVVIIDPAHYLKIPVSSLDLQMKRWAILDLTHTSSPWRGNNRKIFKNATEWSRRVQDQNRILTLLISPAKIIPVAYKIKGEKTCPFKRQANSKYCILSHSKPRGKRRL